MCLYSWTIPRSARSLHHFAPPDPAPPLPTPPQPQTLSSPRAVRQREEAKLAAIRGLTELAQVRFGSRPGPGPGVAAPCACAGMRAVEGGLCRCIDIHISTYIRFLVRGGGNYQFWVRGRVVCVCYICKHVPMYTNITCSRIYIYVFIYMMVLSRRSAPLFGHCVATPSSRCESTLTLRCRVCILKRRAASARSLWHHYCIRRSDRACLCLSMPASRPLCVKVGMDA